MRTGALIILAGRTDRKDDFRRDHKIGALSGAARLALTFTRAGVSPVVCVSGPGDTGQEKELGKLGAILLKGRDPRAEMFENIQTGIAYLEGRCDRAFITPVDIPMVSSDTIRQLSASTAAWTIPTYRGRTGHPVLVGGELFRRILSYHGAFGLRGALRGQGREPYLMEVQDTGVVLDVEEEGLPEDLAKNHELWNLRPDLRVCLCREQVFWGPGVRQLLLLIDSLGSVREASDQMGMSYSKAWKILGLMEDQTGFTVVSRRQGGRGGGEAALTPRGRALLERCVAYEQACKEAAERLFQQYFPDGLDFGPPG